MTQVTAHIIDKQKRNGRTNRQKIIEFCNAPTVITHESIIIKRDIYSHPEGQRPIKRHICITTL